MNFTFGKYVLIIFVIYRYKIHLLYDSDSIFTGFLFKDKVLGI